MSVPGAARTRWRVRLGYPVAFACFLLARPTPLWLISGALIAALGLVLRGAAAGHLRKHEELASSGPYAYTRNPLYLGSALMAAGFLLAGRSWVAVILLVAYFSIFYPAVMRREERELRSLYGAEFEAYAARVPMFWPRWSPARASGTSSDQFSWSLYRRNREYRAALGFVPGIALLALKMYWQG